MHRLAARLGWLLAAFPVWAHAVDYSSEIKPLLARYCVPCHGVSQQKGGLRLDTAASAIRGGEHGPALRPGSAAQSLLLQAILGVSSEIVRMPYKRAPLDSTEAERIRNWIDTGAAFPVDETPSSDRHWSFQPPRQQPPPFLSHDWGRVRNPIDQFILRRLQDEQLSLSPDPTPNSLLRRLHLDLTGLPPTPEDLAAFGADPRSDAYERAVDRLLTSPHYGERWGRWWLDAARYADSNGYSIDSPRSIWPFRDWVVAALNHDMPFDQFTWLQLAGDLIPNGSASDPTSALIATGFHRNTQVNHEGGIDTEQFRIESVIDRVNTTATVWLGLTLACSQCHDHKFDPLTMKDYYRFFAFFNSCENDGHGNLGLEAQNRLEIGSPEILRELAEHRKTAQAAEAELNAWMDRELKPKLAAWESGLDENARSKLKPEVQASLAVTAKERNQFQTSSVFNTFRDQDPEYQRRRQSLDEVRQAEPKFQTTLVMRELPSPRETRQFIKGDFTRPGDRVFPGIPSILPTLQSEQTQPNRLDLARWLVSKENPLTARVLVNRVWQQYFGRGIVETENDFGTQGSPPTHPELLDWLAIDLMEHGWSLKHLHRRIVTSETYRQDSRIPKRDSSTATASAGMERDPLNRWLWRQNRIRLDAEIIRDSMLASSGLLDSRVGGPPVFPPQPMGLDAFTQNKREWKVSTGGDRYRRAIYTHLQRTIFHPALSVFDASDGYFTCTRRLRSNTPLQALTLLNSQAFLEFAQALGRQLESISGTPRDKIHRAYDRCLCRPPSLTESRALEQLLEAELQSGANTLDAWTAVARVILNLDELITRE